MAELNVVLSEQHKALIADLIESGQFHSANEVFEEGLRLVEAERNLEALKEKRLHQAVEEGLYDLDESRFVSLSGQDEIALHLQKLGVRAAGRVGSPGE